MKTPVGWSGGIRVDDKVNQTSFVWSPGLKDTDSDGIEPGRSQSGFAVFRPELPGVARTYMQGRIAEPWGLDNVPDTPFWSQKVDEIQDQDYLLVPVLAPVISIPEPYNGAELARRLRSHAQTWVKYGHATPDALARLNRQFDVLIPALETGNKSSARTAVVSMLTEAFTHHHGMTHDKADEDDDEHDGQPLALGTRRIRVRTQSRLTGSPRALIFNLRYVLHRMQ
ncbi:hypothetical protein LP417_25955 [Polaromonas sp. P1-6]|nr:hypothetical protein LP417_25955 [Polaromonas sp. P1-6]